MFSIIILLLIFADIFLHRFKKDKIISIPISKDECFNNDYYERNKRRDQFIAS